MDDISLGALVGALIAMILLSAFFSASETAMLSLNRYRLRHLIKDRHRGAALAGALLQRPDRLIGLILLGNTFVNIAASSHTTHNKQQQTNKTNNAVATGLLTIVILIFGEGTPK